MAVDIIFSIILLFCLLMTFVPTLPGLPLMFIVTLIFGFVDSFTAFPPEYLIIFGAITLLSIAVDYSSGLIGAKLGGANKTSLTLGLIGLIVGLISFPPFGAFLGLFAGIFMAELIQFHDHFKALKAASYSLAAVIGGTLFNIGLAISFFAIFLIRVF